MSLFGDFMRGIANAGAPLAGEVTYTNNLSEYEMLVLNTLEYSDIACIENKGKTLEEIIAEFDGDGDGNITKQEVEDYINTSHHFNPDLTNEELFGIYTDLKTQGELTPENAQKYIDENKDTIGDINAEQLCDFVNGSNAITQSSFDQYLKAYKFNVGFALNTQDFADNLNTILNNENLASLTILDNTDQIQNDVTATTYGHLDENGNLMDESATVVFRGTDSKRDWYDNLLGFTQVTPMQQAALDYIKRQEYDNIVVTGHSKGGNLSQYVALMSEKVTSCLSINGQGFNKNFLVDFADIIEQNKGKIKEMNVGSDLVNMLLHNVTDNVVYLKMSGDYLHSNTTAANVFPSFVSNMENWLNNFNNTQFMTNLKEAYGVELNTDLINVIANSHAPMPLQRDIEENGMTQVPLNTELARDVEAFVMNVENSTPEILKEKLELYLAPIAELIVDGNNEVDMEYIYSQGEELKDTGLYIAETRDGYNVFSNEDRINTIATLDENGNLETGTIAPYIDENIDINELLNESVAQETTLSPQEMYADIENMVENGENILDKYKIKDINHMFNELCNANNSFAKLANNATNEQIEDVLYGLITENNDFSTINEKDINKIFKENDIKLDNATLEDKLLNSASVYVEMIRREFIKDNNDVQL